MDGETFACKWCGQELVTGDVDGNNVHFVNNHIVDFIDELERGGANEVEAHRRVNALVGGLKTPTR